MKNVLNAILGGLLLVLTACGGKTNNTSSATGDTLKLEYATLLTIVDYTDYQTVEIANPWSEGTTLHTYILVDRNKPLPPHLPKGTILRVPLQKSVVFTTAHASLLTMIGGAEQIKGVADLKYMLLPEVHQRVDNNTIADCGDAMSPNIEKIVDIESDGILLSPFDNSGGYGRLEEIGIPIIECADYMEKSALGRAEWMKFYGLLYGRTHETDSLFALVRNEYQRLKETAKQSKQTRSILTERMTGATWYIAGGQSSVGQIIADANGRYAFADDNHSGSLAMSFEHVLDKFGDADVWIFNHYADTPISYASLATEHHGYTSFKAYKTRNVYFVNSSKVPYFEEVSFRPDYLLREYILLLHPDLRPQLGQLRYYQAVSG